MMPLLKDHYTKWEKFVTVQTAPVHSNKSRALL